MHMNKQVLTTCSELFDKPTRLYYFMSDPKYMKTAVAGFPEECVSYFSERGFEVVIEEREVKIQKKEMVRDENNKKVD